MGIFLLHGFVWWLLLSLACGILLGLIIRLDQCIYRADRRRRHTYQAWQKADVAEPK